MPGEQVRVRPEALRTFCQQALEKLEVSEQDARITAYVLVAAYLRGIASHGVAWLRPFYADWIRDGMIVPRPEIQVVAEMPATAVIDAGAGLGHPVSYRAMNLAIEKALSRWGRFRCCPQLESLWHRRILCDDGPGTRLCWAVHDQHPHPGGPHLWPGCDAGDQSNRSGHTIRQRAPVCIGHSHVHRPFGKLEVYDRLGKPIPESWATDESGIPTTNPGDVLKIQQPAGGGRCRARPARIRVVHKGYGLALWVEILSALFSGAMYADLVYPTTSDGAPLPSQIGHFGAWRVDAFRPLDAFGSAMDDCCSVSKVRARHRVRLGSLSQEKKNRKRLNVGLERVSHCPSRLWQICRR